MALRAGLIAAAFGVLFAIDSRRRVRERKRLSEAAVAAVPIRKERTTAAIAALRKEPATAPSKMVGTAHIPTAMMPAVAASQRFFSFLGALAAFLASLSAV